MELLEKNSNIIRKYGYYRKYFITRLESLIKIRRKIIIMSFITGLYLSVLLVVCFLFFKI